MQTLAGKDLNRYRQGHPRAMLIDLRPRQAFRASHIRGAVNIPYPSMEKAAGRLSADTELIFYCERGGSAMAAARRMEEKGFRTAAVIGAYEDISRLTEIVSGFNI